MPKVKITDKKGLVQETGSGVQVQSVTTFENTVQFDGGSSFHGHLNKVENLNIRSSAYGSDRIELSGSDSAKTFVLGDGATYKVVIPNVVGWHARFTVTGSAGVTALSNNLFLSASDDFQSTAAPAQKGDCTPFRGIVMKVDGTASGKIDEDKGRIRWVASGGAQGGDFVDVEVVKGGTDGFGVITYSGLCIG